MFRVRFKNWLVLLSAVLVLAACGGDTGTSDTTEASEDTTAETEAPVATEATETTGTEAPAEMSPEKSDIRVMPAAIPQFLPVFVAQDQGLFAENGLNVEIVEFEGGAGRSTEAALSGEADLGYTSWPIAFSLAERGQQLKFVTTHAYYAREGGVDYGTHDLVVAEDSPIQTVADLEGTRIGVVARGSNEEAFLVSIMQQVGVDPNSVELIEAFWGDHPSLIEAGEIDVGYMIYPFTGAIIPYGETSGNGFRTLGDPYLGGENEIPEMLGDRGGGLFPMAATPQFVEENPNTIRAWALALREAHQWIVDNPAEALAISEAATGVPADAQKSNPPHLYVTWPEGWEDQLQLVVDIMVTADLLGEGLDVNTFTSDLPFTEEEMTVDGRYFAWDPASLP